MACLMMRMNGAGGLKKGKILHMLRVFDCHFFHYRQNFGTFFSHKKRRKLLKKEKEGLMEVEREIKIE
jgi:hypothetical protein